MFLWWGPQGWHSTPRGVSAEHERSKNHLPWPVAYTGFDAAQDSVGFLGCQSTLPGHVGLLISQDPQSLLLRATLSLFSTQPVFMPGFALTEGQDLHRSHLSILSRSLWMVPLPSDLLTAPHSWVTSIDLLRVHLIPVHVTNKDDK